MNLELDDVQRQLQDSLKRLLSKEYAFELRHQHVQQPWGHSQPVWAQLAELGVLGAAIGEHWGGFGGDAVDQMVVSQALGSVLATEPYHGTVVMAASAIEALGSSKQKDEWLPRIAQGQALLGWAHQERNAEDMTARFEQVDAQYRLNGRKTLVLDAPNCERCIVSAMDEQGTLALFLVDHRSKEVHMDVHRLVDGTLAADLHLNGVLGERLDGIAPEAVPAALQRLLGHGITAVCAELVGVMETVHALTVDYLKTRQQFGRVIGSNQALQHRAVEMLVALEQSRSLVCSLALSLSGRHDFSLGERQFHAAKVLVSRNARRVCQEGIQMHGGIGMTEEYAVGHYMRRVLVLEQLHGDVQLHLNALAQP